MRAALLVALLLATVGCGNGGGESRQLRVLAASSLTDALTELEPTFERLHDGVDVTFQFGPSSALAEQVNQGAPADVLVTADEETMARVDGVDPVLIARNRLSIVVEPGNPEGIGALADLASDGVITVLCAVEVPCGRLGALALTKAGVDLEPAAYEESVKGVVTRVALGEADAGIAYVTDVRAAGGDVDGIAIDIADDPELEAVYPAAVVPGARVASLAEAFVEVLTGRRGQDVLADHGFLAP